MRLTKITDDLYRTEAIPTRKMMLQVVGDGVLTIWLSVDGEAYSQWQTKQVMGSAVAVLDLPLEGMMYAEVRTCNEPTIILL